MQKRQPFSRVDIGSAYTFNVCVYVVLKSLFQADPRHDFCSISRLLCFALLSNRDALDQRWQTFTQMDHYGEMDREREGERRFRMDRKKATDGKNKREEQVEVRTRPVMG